MLFTSRWHNKYLATWVGKKVGFCFGPPRFPLPYEWTNLKQIAPEPAFKGLAYEEFKAAYFAKLDALGVEAIAKLLAAQAPNGEDIVLLCYEDVRVPGDWCHRRMFAEWWLAETGELIAELPNPSPAKGVKPPKPAPVADQVGMFATEAE